MKEKGKTLPKRTPGGTAFKHARAYRGVYLMATPVLVAALIFYYLPMFGIRYAFFTYKGINDPIFVGMKHFVKMFSMPGFWKAFSNTLVLSITKLILNTGAAVIISVLLNELIFLKLKKVFQTIVYIPDINYVIRKSALDDDNRTFDVEQEIIAVIRFGFSAVLVSQRIVEALLQYFRQPFPLL